MCASANWGARCLTPLALLLAACTTTVTSAPAGLASAVVARSIATRVFEVRAEERRIGLVVRYEETRKDGRIWYGVRNEHEQELGIVDREGRAWRYRPHLTEPEWVGTGTVLDGARRILGNAEAALVEVPIDAARAGAP